MKLPDVSTDFSVAGRSFQISGAAVRQTDYSHRPDIFGRVCCGKQQSMMPNDQVRRALELANVYYAPAVKAANQGFSIYNSIAPQLERLARQVREVEDYPRYLLIKSFTFARGGWHDAPLMGASARAVRVVVKELADQPDEEVKRRLDAEIPEYFRENECAALRDMVDRWDLFSGWRRCVFEDAFDAHKNGKYTLSVPTLAPQIEGMLREVTEE